MTMYHYFIDTQKGRKIVPHFTGTNNKPVFPATETYARTMLLLHKPWKNNFETTGRNFIQEFLKYIKSESCPSELKIQYSRAEQAYKERREHHELTSQAQAVSQTDFVDEEVDKGLGDVIRLAGTISFQPDVDGEPFAFDLGEEYTWGTPTIPIVNYSVDEISEWLEKQVEKHHTTRNAESHKMSLPSKGKCDQTGKLKWYELEDLGKDQQDIVYYVLERLMLWEMSAISGSAFKPIRMTIRGMAGTGKSTLIHTLTTAIKRKWQRDDVVAITAPTGSAASAIMGRTIHSRFGISVAKSNSTLSAVKYNELLHANTKLLCLLVDERSMVDAHTLSCLEANIRNTAHGGKNSSVAWGGVPVVLFLGDDGQLPSISKGAFDVFLSMPSSPSEKKDSRFLRNSAEML